MKAFIISDKDYQTEMYEKLSELIRNFFNEKGFEIMQVQIGRDDLDFCMGCFGCWIKKPGECVINDKMSQINRRFMNSDVVVYLSPIVFGQYSANIKNAVDRWLPNMLPFFETRQDSSTMHPPRYYDYPKQIMIGYGDKLSSDDAQLFIDIIKKHRTGVEALIFNESESDITESLNKINLRRESGQL